MLVTRTSAMSNVTRTLKLDITLDQINAHANGMLIQNAMPNLTSDEREFYLTGITSDEWDKMFSEE